MEIWTIALLVALIALAVVDIINTYRMTAEIDRLRNRIKQARNDARAASTKAFDAEIAKAKAIAVANKDLHLVEVNVTHEMPTDLDALTRADLLELVSADAAQRLVDKASPYSVVEVDDEGERIRITVKMIVKDITKGE